MTTLGHALVHTYELSIPILIPIWLDAFEATPSAWPPARATPCPDSDRSPAGLLAAFGVSVAFAALCVVAILVVPAAEFASLLTISALLGFFVFGEQPLLQATVAEHSAADRRGASYGLMYAGVFGVGAAGAAVTGFLLTYASRSALFGSVALVGAAATVTAVWIYRRS